MPNTNYKMGAHLEREAKKVLEDNGYYVMRSAGSYGPFDLAAFSEGHIILIQIRKNRKLSEAEKEAIRRVPVLPQVLKESWTKIPGTYGKFNMETIE